MNEIRQDGNRFYLGENPSDPLAEITFVATADGRFIIDRTYVSEALKGQGVGKMLVDRVVALARDESRKITPQCSFARKVLQRCESCQDILADEPGEPDVERRSFFLK